GPEGDLRGERFSEARGAGRVAQLEGARADRHRAIRGGEDAVAARVRRGGSDSQPRQHGGGCGECGGVAGRDWGGVTRYRVPRNGTRTTAFAASGLWSSWRAVMQAGILRLRASRSAQDDVQKTTRT